MLVFFTSLSSFAGRADYHYPSNNPGEEINHLGFLIAFNTARIKSLVVNGGAHTQIILDEDKTDFVNRMIKLRDKLTTASQKKSFEELLEESKVLGPELAQEIRAEKLREVKPPVAIRPLNATGAPSVVAAPAPTTVTLVASPPGVPVSSTRQTLPKGVTLTDKTTCINAGFPLEYDPCFPVEVLPEEYQIAELGDGASSFNCEDPKQMCNPFLAGYKEKCFTDPHTKSKKCVLDPVCVSRRDNTTKSCLDASAEKPSKDQLLTIWQNPKNKPAYNAIKKTLDEFCKPETVSSKYKTSCNVMQERFNEIRMKAWPSTGQPPASAAPARR